MPNSTTAGTATTAFGKKHGWQTQLLGKLEHPVLLAMILLSLRACQNGVVVRHHDASALRFVEQVTVDLSDPGEHPVGGRP